MPLPDLLRRWAPWVALALVPLLVHAPLVAFRLSADPVYFTAWLTYAAPHGLISGPPGWIDPNSGFTSEALGGLAARDWFRGEVPWWNPYSGVGLPLAAEMQPAAFFLPFSLLLAAPHGVLWLKISMQALTGWACLALLRQLALPTGIALLGAVLYELCGTFAWTAHAPIYPIAFLPLLLLGIERSAAHAAAGRRGGWAWVTVATAYSLYAGFPETAFIDGLLCAAWGALRLAKSPAGARLALARKLAVGLGLGLLLAAPIVVPFLQYLRVSYVGWHPFFGFSPLDRGVYPMILVPYFYGPIGFRPQWASIGGYIGLPLLLLGLLALGARGRAAPPRWLLAGWLVAALAKSAQVPGIAELFNLIPFIGETAFGLYAAPSWELAAVVLACWALDDWHRGMTPRRGMLVAGPLCVLALAGALLLALPAVADMRRTADGPAILAGSLAWTGLATVAVAALVSRRWSPRRSALLGAVLAGYAALVFALPLLGGTRKVSLDREAVRFLQDRLGFFRFYTLGPFQPNYGARFGVASINHNYLPVARAWVDYVRTRLDPGAEDVGFIGVWPASPPGRDDRAEALRSHLPGFAAVGVKYVLAPAGSDPFAGAGEKPARVFGDAVMDIFEVSDPAPYFSAAGCALTAPTRLTVDADCPAASLLVRRELHYPGWRAEVNGAAAEIAPTEAIFQAVALPPGHSEVRFSYAPPGIRWCMAAFCLGLAGFFSGLWRGR